MPSRPTLFSFDLPQAGMAQALKSMLELSQQINARQADFALETMHNALGAFHPGVVSTLRELLDVQADLASGIGLQWKGALDHLLERSGACVKDLQRADDRTEMAGVLALYTSDLGERLRADGQRMGQIVNSAGEAGKVLFARQLDNLIADGAGNRDGRPDPV